MKKIFALICAVVMTTSLFAQTGWVGKWTGKGSHSINAELHLFSDSTFFYSFTATLSGSGRLNGYGSEWSAKYNLWGMYMGTWNGTKDHLNLSVDRSSADGEIIQSRGLDNWNKMGLIASESSSIKWNSFNFDVISRKGNTVTLDWNDVVMTKTNVSTPYYYVPPKTGKFECLERKPFLVFGVYTTPNGNRVVGYWDRDGASISEETASESITFDKEGKELSTKGSNLKRIRETADMLYRAPESGSHEFTYSDGRQYNGMWAKHYPNGQGLMRYPNGDTKEGLWKNGEFIEGSVSLTDDFSDTKYVGEYKNGEKNGQGRYEYVGFRDSKGDKIKEYKEGLWQDGEFIEGVVTKYYLSDISSYHAGTHYDTLVCEYKEGKIKGKGKLRMANGAWYEGLFDKRNFISGKAFVKNANGSTYTGEMKNNKREGEGTYTIGDFVLTGVWANDTIQQGKLSCPDFTYEGTFSNGKFSEGTYKFRSMTLTGKWENQVFQQGDFKLDFSSDNVIKSAQGKYNELFPGMEGHKGIVEVTCVADPLKLSGKYLNGMMEWTITYPNNDQYFGYYRGSYCYRSEENKEFKYTWADGTSATGIVNKKHKPTKLVYANSAGEPIKGKATKGYEMQLPTNDKTVDLPYGVYQSWDIMLQLFRQKISVPEIGQLCTVYFNETYESYKSYVETGSKN